jgi:hypothetical protein
VSGEGVFLIHRVSDAPSGADACKQQRTCSPRSGAENRPRPRGPKAGENKKLAKSWKKLCILEEKI